MGKFHKLMFGRRLFSLSSPLFRIYRSFGENGFTSTPFEVMGLNPSEPLTLKTLNKRYAVLIKKYHPDVNPDPQAAKHFQRIKDAYSQLKIMAKGEERPHGQTHPGEESQEEHEDIWRSNAAEEQKLYFTIFGKTYDEDPEFFYLNENAEKRKAYISKLEKMRKEKINREQFRPDPSVVRPFESYSEDSSSTALIVLIGAAVIAGALYYHWSHKETHKKFAEEKEKNALTPEKMEEMRLKGWEQEKLIIKNKINKIYDELPSRMKKYPMHKAPPAMEILLDYTIWKDIKAYSTFLSKLTPEMKKKIELGQMQVPRSQLDFHRVPSQASVALEAERVLKNVFIDM